jgi:predicted methyltransferase
MRLILTTSMTIAALCLAPAMNALAAPSPGPAMTASDKSAMQAALGDPRRDADRTRDIWRHPAQTLAFFGVKPGMTVVDYLPSGGWYTRVLVPYLGPQGQYIGLNPGVANASERTKQSLGNVAVTFPPKAAGWTGVAPDRIVAFNSDAIPAERKGTVDRVVIFREVHNMLSGGWLYPDLLAIRSLLKPDGMLGIVQHRAKSDAPADYANGNMGYLREKDVIALVEALGFELVGKSEINANPKDPANHPDGVWSLPPTYALGDKNRAVFAAIGESDRMTLLFRKRE